MAGSMRIKPEQRKRCVADGCEVKDRSQNNLAPQIGDGIEKRLKAGRAFDRPAIENPVEHGAVVGFENAICNRRSSVRRGNSVARNRDALLHVNDRSSHIHGDEDRSALADLFLRNERLIDVATVTILPSQELFAPQPRAQSNKEMQGSLDVRDDRMRAFRARRHILRR